MSKKNLYKTNRAFLPNPASALYQTDAEIISKAPEIQEIVQFAMDLQLENKKDSDSSDDFNLDYLIFEIKKNTLSYINNGLIGFKIKVNKLYEGKAINFKSFCQEFLHKTHWQINRTIRAAQAAIELIAHGAEIVPSCEAQVRELIRCASLTGLTIVEAWQYVVDAIEPHQITAIAIHKFFFPEQEKEEPTTYQIEVSAELYQAIRIAAKNAKMTVTELLEEKFEALISSANWHFKQINEKWEEEEEASQDYYQERLESG